MNDSSPVWTLLESHKFCVRLHDFLVPLGYDIGLAGGVLLDGCSDKDIDIIIYPLKKISSNFDAMYQALPNFGLKYVRLPNNNLGYSDDGKRVEVWEYEGKRIDLFFLA